VHQDGEPDIEQSAEYESRPFEDPYFVCLRFEFVAGGRTWGAHLTHHKFYLTNPAPGIGNFEITHGFNVFGFYRAVAWKGARFRAGGGFALAHSESTIRGQAAPDGGGFLDSGYRLTGPVVIVAGGKRFHAGRRVFFDLEVELTGGFARVPVASGHAETYLFSAELMGGIGYRF